MLGPTLRLPISSHHGAGGVEEGALTFQPCMDLVDEWVSVSEADIAGALLGLQDHSQLRLEGALSGCWCRQLYL